MSCEDLRRVADLGRAGILQSVGSSGATMKEVSKGFLVQTVNPDDLPERATVTRRFGVKQKEKVRP